MCLERCQLMPPSGGGGLWVRTYNRNQFRNFMNVYWKNRNIEMFMFVCQWSKYLKRSNHLKIQYFPKATDLQHCPPLMICVSVKVYVYQVFLSLQTCKNVFSHTVNCIWISLIVLNGTWEDGIKVWKHWLKIQEYGIKHIHSNLMMTSHCVSNVSLTGHCTVYQNK